MKRLAEKEVEVHGDEKVMQIADGCVKKELLVPATEEDWAESDRPGKDMDSGR